MHMIFLVSRAWLNAAGLFKWIHYNVFPGFQICTLLYYLLDKPIHTGMRGDNNSVHFIITLTAQALKNT